MVVEIRTPEKFVGQTIEQIGFNKNYNIVVLTKLIEINERNTFGVTTTKLKAGEIVNANTILNANEIIVMYGHKNDITRMLID